MLFTFSSLLILSVALLLVVALFAVRTDGGRDERHRWFQWHLAASLLFILTVLFDDILYGMQPRVFYLLEYPAVLLAALTYGELCYAVAGIAGGRQRRLYRYIVAAAVLAWSVSYYFALNTGAGFSSLLLLPILLFCWPAVMLAAILRQEEVPLFKMGVVWGRKSDVADAQKAKLGFFYTTLLRVIGSAAPVITLKEQFPAEFVYGSFFVLSLTIVAGMVITYLVHIEKRANLAYKITSFLSVFLIGTFVMVVLVFYQEDQAMRERDLVFMQNNAIEITPVDGGFNVSAVEGEFVERSFTRLTDSEGGAFRISLPFAFSFAGHSAEQLLVYENGQVIPAKPGSIPPDKTTPFQRRCIRSTAAIYVLCLPGAAFDVFAATEEDIVVLRWAVKAGEANAGATVQEAVIDVHGKITLAYGAIPQEWSERRDALVGVRTETSVTLQGFTFADMPMAVSRAGYQIDLAVGRREQTHKQLQPVVIFLIAAVAMILFVFRSYMYWLIVRPLSKINMGLRQVDGGQLNERVFLSSRDEFSDLAHGFNRMSASLDLARQRADEQAELMETEIAYRTVEAAKKIDPTILSKDQVFETKLRGVIIDNIGDFDFQVAELADAMAVSTRQLHRRVVDLTAQTPAALIRSLRLEHAHKLLSARAVNVSEASYQSGFKDVSYFSRLFQKKYQISPSVLLSSS